MTTVIIPSDSSRILVDSSGWLEYITEDTKALLFARFVETSDRLLVPTIVLFEVYKKLFSVQGKTLADRFYSQALRRDIVSLDEYLAQSAAVLSVERQLPMADAIIYATAQTHKAQLITSDAHFNGLPGVTLL